MLWYNVSDNDTHLPFTRKYVSSDFSVPLHTTSMVSIPSSRGSTVSCFKVYSIQNFLIGEKGAVCITADNVIFSQVFELFASDQNASTISGAFLSLIFVCIYLTFHMQ